MNQLGVRPHSPSCTAGVLHSHGCAHRALLSKLHCSCFPKHRQTNLLQQIYQNGWHSCKETPCISSEVSAVRIILAQQGRQLPENTHNFERKKEQKLLRHLTSHKVDLDCCMILLQS